MKTLAAVLVATGMPLELVELEVPPLSDGQVLVEVAYTAVCHTQLLEVRGHRGEDRFLPHCLGHEGSGVVADVGRGVTRIAPGQPVVLSWIKGPGADVPGTRYRWGDRIVNAGGITTFSQLAVLSENRVMPLGCSLAMDRAAFLGCALPTGVGAVLNTGHAREGESAVIFGAGGIGLCAVAGASIAGASPVVAVDVVAAKLERARQMGASAAIDARSEDVPARLAALCPGGVGLAIEATGRPEVMRMALECVRPRGGRVVVVGNARHGEKLTIDPWHLNQGKCLLGTWGGDHVPDRDTPKYAALMASGRLDVGPMMSSAYALVEINRAIDDLEAGRAIRPLVAMTTP